ncbi:hypothetical protein WMG39_21410, partial [Microcoleus anatoxicus PTRS2]
FPIPDSPFPIPDSPFPIPHSRFPIPPNQNLYTTIYNTQTGAKILGTQKNPNRGPLNVQKYSSKHY